MGRRESLIKELEIFKRKLKEKYNINKIIFFGSRATGIPHRDSDIDLIIVSKNFRGKSALKRSPQLYSEWDLDYAVDFLCYTPEEFNKLKGKITIVNEAIKNGILIK